MKAERNVQTPQVGRTFSSLSLCPDLGSETAAAQSNRGCAAQIRATHFPSVHICAAAGAQLKSVANKLSDDIIIP